MIDASSKRKMHSDKHGLVCPTYEIPWGITNKYFDIVPTYAIYVHSMCIVFVDILNMSSNFSCKRQVQIMQGCVIIAQWITFDAF